MTSQLEWTIGVCVSIHCIFGLLLLHPALTYSIPMASIDPTLFRVPDIYQQEVTFTCTGKVPRTLVVEMEIVWLADGVETTSGVGPITNPLGTSSTSELQTLTQNASGTYNYTCVVTLAVAGDPVLQDAATAIVNITSKCVASWVWLTVHVELHER